MQLLNLKPSHKLVTNYYRALGQFGQLNIDHEMAVRDAFQDLLKGCGQKFHWTLVPEYSFSRPKQNPIRIDGALLDTFRLPRGYWEAKDEHDDLDKEIRAKLDKGYPRTNIIFQAPKHAVLIQNGVRQGLNQDITDSANLVELLKAFFGYREPHYEEWDDAVSEFKDYIPQIAGAVKDKIEGQRRTNPAFVQRFDAFYELCRQSINPNLSVAAVEEMLIQHLMTERIFRRIFDNSDFTRRNVIAVEIEKIIDSMTAREFSRDAFLKDLDRFYRAIELAAENTETYKQKQDFINTVYERFFQGYSPKEADTHGIVYTPQPIVDFMVRSVEDILKKEFGRSLSDKDVHVLDPFVGTGNFITRVMKEIKTSALPYKYENELHCNEVMLLPYYVASMNIEHEYLERTGEYEAFPGICLVDTFELAENKQPALFTEENTNRVDRQRRSPIFVAIGNPPYNMGQVNESDENKNRKYEEIDNEVRATYAKDSKATLLNKLSDPYVKAVRWASNRIGDEGVVAFVTNSSFIEQIAFDGMRRHLREDFDSIYVLNLGGNVRKNPKLSGTTHNVFGIQVGVSISIFVRCSRSTARRNAEIHYLSVDEYWRKEQKYAFLEEKETYLRLNWTALHPDRDENWITSGMNEQFRQLVPLTDKEQKADLQGSFPVIFQLFSLGVVTNRDAYTYSFDQGALRSIVDGFLAVYDDALAKAKMRKEPKPKGLVDFSDIRIKWTRQVISSLFAREQAAVQPSDFRTSLYRPFTKRYLLFNSFWNEEQYKIVHFFPTIESERDNRLICLSAVGNPKAFHCLMASYIPNLHLTGDSQCLGFYRYSEDGSNRRENITDWALNEFRTHYSDPNITKWDIFHYVYAVLHYPEYRERYAANLKRELPRIPFVSAAESPKGETIVAQGVSPGSAVINDSESLLGRHKTGDPSTRAKALARDDNGEGVGGNRGPSTPAATDAASAQDDRSIFWRFVEAGRNLAALHVNYEQQPEYPLERVEKGQLNWRVEKMRLSKDKTSLVYNDFPTLRGIPPETYEYRLGNRSALEWVIDQYQVSTDKRSGITNDPNRADDPEYIVRLIGQVITVSLETIEIVSALPNLNVAVNVEA